MRLSALAALSVTLSLQDAYVIQSTPYGVVYMCKYCFEPSDLKFCIVPYTWAQTLSAFRVSAHGGA